MKRTQIYLSEDLHDKLENFAFIFSKQENKKVTMSEIVRRALEKYLEKEDFQPNEATLKAIAEFDDIDNVESSTVDEFFKDIGLDKI